MSINNKPHYYVPNSSHHPIITSLALGMTGFGASLWVNHKVFGMFLCLTGIIFTIYCLFSWFNTAINESENKCNGENVDISYRWSMSWFIASEIMFFFVFFIALFYIRSITTPWLGSIDNQLLWPNFSSVWPNTGPSNLISTFHTVNPWPIPTINTLILLISGMTITIAHKFLFKNERQNVIRYIFITILLGISFIALQIYEYIHAYQELNLKLTSGIYGSIFFMLTGFHGLHVTIGIIMLSIILMRFLRGHFSIDRHFGFEATIWYWHFVDIIWFILYVVVYLL